MFSEAGFSPNLLTAGVLVNSLMPLIKKHIFLSDFGKVVIETWGSDRDQDRTCTIFGVAPTGAEIVSRRPGAWERTLPALLAARPCGRDRSSAFADVEYAGVTMRSMAPSERPRLPGTLLDPLPLQGRTWGRAGQGKVGWKVGPRCGSSIADRDQACWWPTGHGSTRGSRGGVALEDRARPGHRADLPAGAAGEAAEAARPGPGCRAGARCCAGADRGELGKYEALVWVQSAGIVASCYQSRRS